MVLIIHFVVQTEDRMETTNANINIKVPVVYCSRLALAGCQVLTRASLLLACATGQGRENKTRGSWAEITGRGHSPNSVTGKRDKLRILTEIIAVKFRAG